MLHLLSELLIICSPWLINFLKVECLSIFLRYDEIGELNYTS